MTVASVHGDVPTFHFVALGHVGIEALAHSLRCPPHVVLGRLASWFTSANMDLVCERHLRVVEGTVQNTKFPWFPCT